MYINQQDAQISVIKLYFLILLHMFRTILVHYQEQHYKLYIAFGICRYRKSGCCVAIATQQPDLWYRQDDDRCIQRQTDV